MLDIIETAAKSGGKVLTHYFRKIYQTSHKGNFRNIVTTADLESQKIIQQTIQRMMQKKAHKASDIGFIGEENLHISGDYQFIIDPLDGTTNFASGLDLFTVSIAAYTQGKPICGVVYQPLHDILYFAEKDKGAFKKINNRDTKLVVNHQSLNQMVITAHLTSNPLLRQQMSSVVTKLASKTLGIRHLGVITLEQCYFTENIFGVVINANHYIWDTAATQLIVEEAGGILSDWKGNRLTYDFNNPTLSYNSMSCHPDNLKSLLPYLK
ncbi:hypothetical protein A3C23_01085 [Candidatus Roizmanbacteria bacterium RIFCSPHIGHO2_02_FULL_37_13b]|uniref:Inositol-phosphate phosphatase n=1 Tax=Candidatus Roizmanbacteria bacterium RIFCSPLOWO2_02_FULL_36_11 TaxID=1802071 RepID=A0A1F7JIR6_9BACT|nr:MAG: hypothetical protein A3C23_01085 [Candidatus Roizmanbacteria bacterium RIFCSPHIGHO2_02_FULL_37_13b]OGK55514.1 MAG: hypothetical protein A3H78_05100 [Candidatus Roizmanbacteria bacterium RIFCSPLOWO2_02_FULL_36_11]